MSKLKLREFRENFKMSQSDVAQELNLTQQAYSSWEKGKSHPNANQILQLCKIFKCTPNDLFGIKGVYTVALAELDKS